MLDVSRHFFPVTDVKAYINKMSEYKVVISPTTYAYLDYTQGDHSVENPIYANLSLESSYEFEPIPDGVDPELILGGQGNLWTEAVPDLSFAFYMTYPRAFALAEGKLDLRTQVYRDRMPLGRELILPRSVLEERVVAAQPE